MHLPKKNKPKQAQHTSTRPRGLVKLILLGSQATLASTTLLEHNRSRFFFVAASVSLAIRLRRFAQ